MIRWFLVYGGLAGSSLMPGKVNPVIPEAVAMVCALVIGNDTEITVAGQSGNFQLYAMLPLVAHDLLSSINLLTGAVRALVSRQPFGGFRLSGMGSTKRVRRREEWLFGLLARHVYPVPYTFDDTAVRIFNDAVRLGGISGCRALNQVDYDQYLDRPLRVIRRVLDLETDLLAAYYRIEMKRCPNSVASQRLLD